MILVDASVWIDHFRHGNATLRALQRTDRIACHPFVVGELACGVLPRREEVLELLNRLPMLAVADHDEVLALVATWELAGRGVGWVDVHLLASVRIERARLFTLDRRLAAAAARLGVV